MVNRLLLYLLAMLASAIQVAWALAYQYFVLREVDLSAVIGSGPFFFIATAWVFASFFELMDIGALVGGKLITVISIVILAFVLSVSTFGYVGLLNFHRDYDESARLKVVELEAKLVQQGVVTESAETTKENNRQYEERQLRKEEMVRFSWEWQKVLIVISLLYALPVRWLMINRQGGLPPSSEIASRNGIGT